MLPNRLKMDRRKQSVRLRPTKLTLAFHQRSDFDNIQNIFEREPIQKTQVIKSTPNIQICSSKFFTSHNNDISPFNQIQNRPLTHRKGSRYQLKPNDYLQAASKQLSECNAKLQESSLKIDENKATITVLTAQNQSLKNNLKDLEKVNKNFNIDYYQHQITRLKAESWKYRDENIENIEKLQKFYNQRSQMQESKKKLVEESKNQMKQFQRQKLMANELKNQQSQKEKMLSFALQESQKANQMLNIRNIDLAEGNVKLQKEVIEKKMIIQSLNKQVQIFSIRFQQCQKTNYMVRKRYQQILREKEINATNNSNDYKSKIAELEDNISKLTHQVNSLKKEHSERSDQIDKVNINIKIQQQIIEKSLKIKNLESQNNDLKFIVSGQDKTIQKLQLTLKEYFSPEQYVTLEKKIKQVQEKRLISAKYYEQKLQNLQKENERLKLEMISTKNISTYVQNEGQLNFNQILKKNIEEFTSIKQQLKAKIDQNQELMRELIDIRLKVESYTNQIQILTKKLQSKEKNIRIQLQVQRQKFTNETESLRRKMQTLETRLQYKISENKQKDDFIKNTIMGRTKPSDVPLIVSQLDRIFLQRDKLQVSRQ